MKLESNIQSTNQLYSLSERQILDHTLSLCSTCYKVIPAQIVESNGKVFLEKECCKKESVLLENDVEFYKKAILPFSLDETFVKPNMCGMGNDLRDKFIDNATHVGLSINLKCNLKCPICYLRLGPLTNRDRQIYFNEPTISEITSIVKRFRNKLVGVVGGEPTLREDLPEIIRLIRKSKNIPFLATNGIKLLDRNYVKKIKKAGIAFVTTWFDGFNPAANKKLRGKDLLDLKLKVLKNLRDEKINVNILSVIGKGINDDQIPSIIRFAIMSKIVKCVTFSSLYTGENILKETTTPSDILKALDFSFGMKLSEWHIEEKRLRYEIYNLMKKIFGKGVQKKYSYILSDSVYLKVKGRNFSPLFSLDEIRKINEALDSANSKESKFDALISLVKNFHVFLNPRLIKIGLLTVLDGLNLSKASVRFQSDILKLNFTVVRSFIHLDFKRHSLTGDAVVTIGEARE
jgi:MoaA/NifB/PqqE/SkfB family radical SAM enzyme